MATHVPVTPVLWGTEIRGWVGLPGYQPSSKSSDRPCVKKIRKKVMIRAPSIFLWSQPKIKNDEFSFNVNCGSSEYHWLICKQCPPKETNEILKTPTRLQYLENTPKEKPPS